MFNAQCSMFNGKLVPLHPISGKVDFGEMVEWSITAVLKTAALRGAGCSNPSLSANNAENQQVTNLHPDLHPLLVNLGVILHPLSGVPLIDEMLKVLKF